MHVPQAMRKLNFCLVVLMAVLSFRLVSASAPGDGMKSFFEWDVGDVSVYRHGSDSVLVDIRFDVKYDGVARNSAVVLQPYVMISGIRTDLIPVSFYSMSRDGTPQAVRRDGVSASRKSYEIAKVAGGPLGDIRSTSVLRGFDFYEDIEVFVEVRECVRYEKETRVETRRIAGFSPVPCPVFRPKYFPLSVEAGRYSGSRELVSVLDLGFRTGSSSVDLSLGTNGEKLNGFVDRVRSVVLSPVTKVSDIRLEAYCSPVGDRQANEFLLKKRLDAVCGALTERRAFSRKPVQRVVCGEDWAGVEEWVSGSAWSRDSVIASVLSIPLDDVSMEDTLRNVYMFWDDLHEYLIPTMDRIECSMTCVILPDAYASDEERREAYEKDMRLLSQRDFSLLLSSVETWSPTWYDMAFGFVSQYPDCREALVNVFAGCMRLGSMNEAAKYLRRLEEHSEFSDVRYYLAVWHMLQDNVLAADSLAGSLDDVRVEYRQLKEQVTAIREWRQSVSPWEKELFRKF